MRGEEGKEGEEREERNGEGERGCTGWFLELIRDAVDESAFAFVGCGVFAGGFGGVVEDGAFGEGGMVVVWGVWREWGFGVEECEEGVFRVKG